MSTQNRWNFIPYTTVTPDYSLAVIFRTVLLFLLSWYLYIFYRLRGLPRLIKSKLWNLLPDFISIYFFKRQSPSLLRQLDMISLDEDNEKTSENQKLAVRVYSSYVWGGGLPDLLGLLKENYLSPNMRKVFLAFVKVWQGKLYLRDYLRTDQDLSYSVIRSVVSVFKIWNYWYTPIYIERTGITQDIIRYHDFLKKWPEIEVVLKNGGLDALVFWDLNNASSSDHSFFNKIPNFLELLDQYRLIAKVLEIKLPLCKYERLITKIKTKIMLYEDESLTKELALQGHRKNKKEPTVAAKGKFRVVKINIAAASGLTGTTRQSEDYIFVVEDQNTFENARKIADNLYTESLQTQVHDDTGKCIYHPRIAITVV